MGRGVNGTAADFALVASAASTARKTQLMRAMLAAGAYQGSGANSNDGFYALWALTKDCRRPFLPDELKLPDSRFSGVLSALEADGFVESHFIGQQHLTWRLTPKGVSAAQAIEASSSS